MLVRRVHISDVASVVATVSIAGHRLCAETVCVNERDKSRYTASRGSIWVQLLRVASNGAHKGHGRDRAWCQRKTTALIF